MEVERELWGWRASYGGGAVGLPFGRRMSALGL